MSYANFRAEEKIALCSCYAILLSQELMLTLPITTKASVFALLALAVGISFSLLRTARLSIGGR